MKIEQVGVTGYVGRVGSRLVAAGARPIDVDVTQEFSIPDDIKVVINCAAMSSPQVCEDNVDVCFKINAGGVNNLINACYPNRVALVHLSSDHVFSGKKLWGTYKEDEGKHPVNWYGMSKMVGETFTLDYEYGKVIRTSMLFDDPSKLHDYHADRVSIWIKRTFMHLDAFVECLEYYIENFDKMPQVLHISGTEKISWFDFISRAKYVAQEPGNIKRRWWFTKGTCNRPINGGLNVSLAKRLGVPVEGVREGLWRWNDKRSSSNL